MSALASPSDADDALTVDVGDAVATVVLNRPQSHNALTLRMWLELARIFDCLGADPTVRAVILRGAGRTFSSGADISEFAAVRADARQAAAYEAAVDACADAIFRLTKPTIAAIDGYCLGGACHLALACDFRLAGPAARIGVPTARLSIVYGVKTSQRLLATVGLPAAKRILFGAERFDGTQALAFGLVDDLAEDVYRAASDRARLLAENAPLSIAGSKQILNALAMGSGVLDSEAASRLIDAAASSEDYEEGRRAFAEKRRPVFRGR